jgi:Na+-translocating membrane potential-generating system (MpsC)
VSRFQSQPRNADAPSEADARVGSAISDAMVALIREAVGRGPKRARTFIHEDVILCLLEETMTPLERTLHEQDRDDAVQDIRDVLHSAMGPRAARTGRGDHRPHRDRDARRSPPAPGRGRARLRPGASLAQFQGSAERVLQYASLSSSSGASPASTSSGSARSAAARLLASV